MENASPVRARGDRRARFRRHVLVLLDGGPVQLPVLPVQRVADDTRRVVGAVRGADRRKRLVQIRKLLRHVRVRADRVLFVRRLDGNVRDVRPRRHRLAGAQPSPVSQVRPRLVFGPFRRFGVPAATFFFFFSPAINPVGTGSADRPVRSSLEIPPEIAGTRLNAWGADGDDFGISRVSRDTGLETLRHRPHEIVAIWNLSFHRFWRFSSEIHARIALKFSKRSTLATVVS